MQDRADKSIKFGWRDVAKGVVFGPSWPLYMKKFGQRMEEVEEEAARWRERAQELEGAEELLRLADDRLGHAVREREEAEEAKWQAREDRTEADRDRTEAQARLREAEEMERVTGEERRAAEEDRRKARDSERRARAAGVWATRRRVGLIEQLAQLREREREMRRLLRDVQDQRATVRVEETRLEMKRLGIFPTNAITDEDLQAARSAIGYIDGMRNICVTGAPGCGKSSLINALRGLRTGDPDAAPITHVGSWSGADDTVIREVYLDGSDDGHDDARPSVADKERAGVVFHEVAVGRSGGVSAWDYYFGEKLWAYDQVVFVHEAATELATRLQQIAEMRSQPCTVVRAKADQHIRNFHYTALELDESATLAGAHAAFLAEVRRDETRRRERSSVIEALRPTQGELIVSAREVYRAMAGVGGDEDEMMPRIDGEKLLERLRLERRGGGGGSEAQGSGGDAAEAHESGGAGGAEVPAGRDHGVGEAGEAAAGEAPGEVVATA